MNWLYKNLIIYNNILNNTLIIYNIYMININ